MATSQSTLRCLFQYHEVLLHGSGKEDVTLTEHHELVELIGRGQPDAAVRAMRAHLDRSIRLYAHRNGPSVSPG